MDGKPHRQLVRCSPVDAMFFMGLDQDIVAGDELSFCFSLKLQPCRAAQDQNPFRMVLVIPEAWGRGMPEGADAFHPEPFSPKEFRKSFFLLGLRQMKEDIKIRDTSHIISCFPVF